MNELDFPIKYEYSYVTPGDYVSTENIDLSYRYASALRYGYEIEAGVIKVLVDTSNVNDMNYMFARSGLKSFLLFDTSKVTNMSNMFDNCDRLSYVPLIDTSNVDNMYMMFSSCSKLKNIPQLDTSNVTTMKYMFSNCSSLITIPQLDTSNVTNMESMFSNCSSLITIPQLDTSNVTEMYTIFNGCKSLKRIPLLDCQNVKNIGGIFGYSDITSPIDLDGFRDLGKISSVSGTSSTFLDKLPNLTHQSLMNVINNLYDRKSNGLSNISIKFGTTNLNKLSDEEKAIAINKGWNLS